LVPQGKHHFSNENGITITATNKQTLDLKNANAIKLTKISSEIYFFEPKVKDFWLLID